MPDLSLSDTSRGTLVMKTIAMPQDTNANGDIFGGWLLSQMDLGGALLAKETAHTRVATVAIQSMVFLEPVKVGDVVSCYARLEKMGRTSMHIAVEAWVKHWSHTTERKVTDGIFVYVAIDKDGRPFPIAELPPLESPL